MAVSCFVPWCVFPCVFFRLYLSPSPLVVESGVFLVVCRCS